MLPGKRPFRFTVTNNIKCEHHALALGAGSRPLELLDRLISIKINICACDRGRCFRLELKCSATEYRNCDIPRVSERCLDTGG
jgi:hypothetical protein